MKKNTFPTLTIAALTAVSFTSCASNDPEYKEWKKKKDEEAATANNPYGAPSASADNPYGVPQNAGETGSYTPSNPPANNAPYQQLPGVAQDPGVGAPGNTGGTNISHTVVSGDSLWGLARKYNTSIESIQAANNLTTTTIRTGQTLSIPAR